ncbi:MAG: 3'-5' exonuclease [Candidatus Eisenbacteria bacterium]
MLIAVDTETTGMSPQSGARLVEVARVAIADGALGEGWSSLVNPGVSIPPDATRVHGITDAMVAAEPIAVEVGPMLRSALGDAPLVFHNAFFDLPFLQQLFREAGVTMLMNPVVDTLGLARGLFSTGGNALGALTTKLGLPMEATHRALGDTRMTARLFLALAERWERDKGVRSVEELAAVSVDVMRATARR